MKIKRLSIVVLLATIIVPWLDVAQAQQLPIAMSAQRTFPASTVLLPLPNVVSITAGGTHTCALMKDGKVMCWGAAGTIGDGTLLVRSVPVDVVELPGAALSIAAGEGHTCALMIGGGVKCWGLNDFGDLGDGTYSVRLTPVDVVGLTSGVVAISAGGAHTCVVTASGGAKCWGDNKVAQLGDGSHTLSPTPVDVTGLDSGVTAIAAGGGHTCSLTSSGGVKCWGRMLGGNWATAQTQSAIRPWT